MNCSAIPNNGKNAKRIRKLSAECFERIAEMRAKDVGEFGDTSCGFDDGALHRVIGYCENCGLPVYSGDEALYVKASGDTIHSACWDYYAADHVELFTESADTEREE